jgi:ABC-2 type transport system ATP-binding protein
MDAGSPAIAVRGLRKTYAGRAVLDGIDFEVPTGSIMALLGPNGAGKTTTVEILEGYRRADAGEVRVLGLDPVRDGRALRARVGLMLQGGGIYPQARPLELLRLFARFYRHPVDPDGLLENAGLAAAADVRYRVLSGGQKQRLSLALALVGRPEVVVLDEPTAGMDPHAKASTRELIAALRATGVTVLLTTHELADVERLADRVAIIDRGRIVAQGTVTELAGGAGGGLRLRLAEPLSEADRRELEVALRSGGSEAGEPRLADDDGVGRYRVVGAEPGPRLVAALAGWAAAQGRLIVEMRTAGTSLEDRYLELTGARGQDES